MKTIKSQGLNNFCYRCGFSKFAITATTKEIECDACGTVLKISNGEIVLPLEINIAKKRDFLLQSRNLNELKLRATDLQKIQPESLLAEFCSKLGNKEKKNKQYKEFLAMSHNIENDEYKSMLEFIMEYFKLDERDHVALFIDNLNSEEQSEWRTKLEKASLAAESAMIQKPSKSTFCDEKGNTFGNIANGGYIALNAKSDCEYVSNGGDNYKLYKKINRQKPQKLSDDMCRCINVLGDWVYYINISDGLLYKISIDGGASQRLSTDKMAYVSVVGKWIYFSNVDEDGTIYKIHTVTGETKEFKYSGRFCQYLNVAGDYVYYRSGENEGKLYRIHTDTIADKIELCQDDCLHINVVNDKIFYINASDGYKIYVIGVNGKESKRLFDDNVMCRAINVDAGWIYYTTDMGKCTLVRRKISGRGKPKIITDDATNCWHINIAGDWIYFRNRSKNSALYKVKTNGKEMQAVIL